MHTNLRFVCLALALALPLAGLSTPANALAAQPTPQPCSLGAAYQDAKATNSVVPIYPSGAPVFKQPIAVLVDVHIADTGTVDSAHITQSSSNGSIDRAAIDAAIRSTYTPKIVNCAAVASDALFSAEFDPPTCALATANRPVRALSKTGVNIPASVDVLNSGTLTARALVHLSSTGSVLGVVLVQSSGNAAFDDAVLVAARRNTFAPEVVNCVPVAGTYSFDAVFTPDSH